MPAAAAPVVSYPAMHEFMRVGHSLITIVLAFLGGVVAAFLYSTRARGQTEKAEPVAKG
jgi:hypothetical protein